MNARILLIVAGFIFSSNLRAQTVVKGVVFEGKSSHKLADVFVRDINTKEISLTDKAGNFSIRTVLNHTLIFTSPGYISDTLFLVDLKPKRIELALRGITLNQVNITSNRGFNPREEYPDVYEKSKFALSPSRIFGKDAKDARRLKRYFGREVEERQIDSAFSVIYVSSIVPLRGNNLENFMSMYRPSYAQIKAPHSSLTLYINDSYKKFMALPPDKRILQPLNSN